MKDVMLRLVKESGNNVGSRRDIASNEIIGSGRPTPPTSRQSTTNPVRDRLMHVSQ